MTQDEIIEMAIQAGIAEEIAAFNIPIIEAFAKLVAAKSAAKEREACAKFCESNQVWVSAGKRGFTHCGHDHFVMGGRHQGQDYADAIRARGEA